MSVDSPAESCSSTEREYFSEKFSASTLCASATYDQPSQGAGWAISAIVDAEKWFSDECSIRTDETYLFKTSAAQPYVAGQLVEMSFFGSDNLIALTFEKEEEQ